MGGRWGSGALFLACCAAWLGMDDASMAAYPEHAVHIIVGVAPGGNLDSTARIIARGLSEKWGQPVIVENKPGADTAIAADFVAHAPPDGYTLDMIINSHTVPSAVKLNFDPIKSFAPITRVASHAEFLVGNATLPVGSLKDLIAYAKSRPGILNYGSSGPGSTPYLEMRLLTKGAGIDMVNVNYQSMGKALEAALGGEIQLMFGSGTVLIEQIKAGKVKGLAVSSAVRSKLMPELPTIAEAANLPGYDVTAWEGLLAPAATPKAIIAKLHDDVVAVLNQPEIGKRISSTGNDVIADSSDAFGQFLREDIARWSALVGSN